MSKLKCNIVINKVFQAKESLKAALPYAQEVFYPLAKDMRDLIGNLEKISDKCREVRKEYE